MTAADDVRERLRGTNPQAIATNEAEGNRQAARDREMARWAERAKKPMKVFEGVLKDIKIEPRSGVRQTGEEWASEAVVSYWDDVLCYEGQAQTTTEFRYPGDGKSFSKFSEGAIVTRIAIEGNPDAKLQDYYDLLGKKLLNTGDWEPTFLGDPTASGIRYWNGAYFYRITILGDTVKTVSAPDPGDLRRLAAFCVGKEPSEVKNMALAKFVSQTQASTEPWNDEIALNSLIQDKQGAFLEYAVNNGLLELTDGKYTEGLPFE